MRELERAVERVKAHASRCEALAMDEVFSDEMRAKNRQRASDLRLILSALTAIAKAGFAVVPVNPTEAMLKAAAHYENQCAIHNYGGCADADGIYAAMIAAGGVG